MTSIAEVKGNLKTLKEQQEAILERMERFSNNIDRVQDKIKKLEKNEEKN